jgi:glycosyltransferase involved in cell wall biosynthesis
VIYQKVLKLFPTLLYQFILKGKKYDVEFAAIHGFRDEILNSPQKSSKKLIWIHNDLKKTEFHDYTDEEFRKFFGYDKIMVISEKIEQDFESLAQNAEEKEKIVRIYNPLDTEEILRKSENKTTDCFVPRNDKSEPVFISVGTVFPQKGFDRLLKIHKKLLDEGFLHEIQILGDGYDFENIKNLQKELNVTETSTLFGFTDNPYPYFKNADFYILSSRYEGFPTVLFEAITLKKNIIATDVSGVKEMLKDGKLGLIVENSEEGIYFGMKKALENPESFEKYSENLLDYEMPFNLENSISTITNIINTLK